MDFHIVVVDDEPDNLKLFTTSFERKGLRVSTAENGIEALEIIQKELPDFLFSDYQMPELDGRGLVEALMENERLKTIPCIIASGLSRSEVPIEDSDNIRVIQKPFIMKETLELMREMCPKFHEFQGS